MPVLFLYLIFRVVNGTWKLVILQFVVYWLLTFDVLQPAERTLGFQMWCKEKISIVMLSTSHSKMNFMLSISFTEFDFCFIFILTSLNFNYIHNDADVTLIYRTKLL